MFTGLVEATGEVLSVAELSPGVRLRIAGFAGCDDIRIGDSIAVSGCCLTVVNRDADWMEFEAGEETLSRTVLGTWNAGSRMNLERSLRVGDRMGGHFVSGHVDCVGRVHAREDKADWSTVWFELPAQWMRHLVPKGCICVDGVSLTVVEVIENRFSVALIPHTLSQTTLGGLHQDDRVNIETDLLAKYIERSHSWTREAPS